MKIIYGTSKYPGLCRDSEYQEKIENICKSVCFTETPLDQIHCLMDVKIRQVQLKPYGLVFIKDTLLKTLNDFNPVLYLNTHSTTNFGKNILETLWRCAFEEQPLDSKEDKRTSQNYLRQDIWKLLAFIESFRKSYAEETDIIDFYWEREWRSLTDIELKFGSESEANIFLGLCKHEDISNLEEQFDIKTFSNALLSPALGQFGSILRTSCRDIDPLSRLSFNEIPNECVRFTLLIEAP